MITRQNNAIKVGVSGLDLLLWLFIAFKLAKIIDWSWWWVFSPLWVPIAVLVVLWVVVVIMGAIGAMLR